MTRRRTWMSGWSYVAALVIVSAVFLGANLWAKHRLHFIQGEPKGGCITRGHVVLVDRVHIRGGVRSPIDVGGYRLIALDRQNGQQVAERIFDDGVVCWAAKADHVWCDSNGQLLNLELPALTTRGEVAAVTGGKALVRDRYATTAAGDLQVLFTDGNSATIDGETLAVTPLTAPDFGGASRTGHPFKTIGDLKRPGGGYLRFSEGPKHRLGLAEKNYGAFTPNDDALSFLHRNNPNFVVTADPDLVLINSETSLAEDSPKLLTRVDERGEKLLWQVTLATRTPDQLVIDGHTASMTTADPNLRALAVDLDTGKTLWRFALPRD